MIRYRYFTCDVFTDRVFCGNPLAVLPDARGLTDAQMQAVAREFNYSETTFVLPPADPRHAARVRIFTPGRELPLAGHPTIGTAFVLATTGAIAADAGEVVFRLAAEKPALEATVVYHWNAADPAGPSNGIRRALVAPGTG